MTKISTPEYVKQIILAAKRDDAETVQLLLEEFADKKAAESNVEYRDRIIATFRSIP